MKRTTTAFASAMILAAGSAQAADLKICVEGAYPPFSQTTESGEVTGFDIDIANALCDEMGVSCELQATEWDGIIPALLERKCDAIIASMSITPDRMKVIDFSAKYYQTPAKFVAKTDADFTDSKQDMAGKRVGVQRGTTHQDYMESEYPDTDLALYGTQDEAYLDLVAGRVDALMADSIAMTDGFLNTEQGEGFAFLGGDHVDPEYHGDGAGIGVRKDDKVLRYALSAAIEAIREKGIYGFINAKYFNFDIYGG